MKTLLPILLLALTLPAFAKGLSDAQIKQQIIKESIADYSGSCACPYNTDRAGRSCGRRSAYSKPGGFAPICYDKDVTPEMVKEWREQNTGK